MALDIIPSLHPLLDSLTATGGGRTQRFRYLPFGRHQDDRRWKAIQDTATGTAPDSVLTLKHVANPTKEADTGGRASRNKQVVDIIVMWQDGEDITDPDLFRRSVVTAVKAVIHANRGTISPASFVRVINVLNGDSLLGLGETSSLSHAAIVTVEAEAHEVY